MASLQERLDGFKKSFESGAPLYNAPREAIEKMDRATAELKASGIENRASKVGGRSPSFALMTSRLDRNGGCKSCLQING
jgi:hypothetical protein